MYLRYSKVLREESKKMPSEMIRPLLITIPLYGCGVILHWRRSEPQIRMVRVIALVCGTRGSSVSKAGVFTQWLALWYLIGVLLMVFRHRYDLLTISGIIGIVFAVLLATVYLIISLVINLFR